MGKPIDEAIGLKVKNNTNLPQSVNILGGTQDPNSVPPSNIYEYDLSVNNFATDTMANILITTTANPTPVAYDVQINGTGIGELASALNTLGIGVFQVSGSILYVSNDFYIYGKLTLS